MYDKFLWSWNYLLFTSQVDGKEKTMKDSGVEIRTGRDHSPNTIMGKPDSTWGLWLNSLLRKSQQDNEK